MSSETIVSKLGKSYPKKQIDRREKELLAEINAIRRLPENKKCSECGDAESCWGSVTLGVFFCTQCAQIHRGLGAHVSKVKSCMGTYVWLPDEIAAMCRMGNARAVRVYGGPSPAPKEFRELDRIARDKYDLRKWGSPGGWQALWEEEELAKKKKKKNVEAPAPKLCKPARPPVRQPELELRVPTQTKPSFIVPEKTSTERPAAASASVPHPLDELFADTYAAARESYSLPWQPPQQEQPSQPAQKQTFKGDDLLAF